jgi:hypothetical protein
MGALRRTALRRQEAGAVRQEAGGRSSAAGGRMDGLYLTGGRRQERQEGQEAGGRSVNITLAWHHGAGAVFFQWLQEIGRPVLYKERQAGSKARQERKAGWMVFTSQSLDAGGRRQEAGAAGGRRQAAGA